MYMGKGGELRRGTLGWEGAESKHTLKPIVLTHQILLANHYGTGVFWFQVIKQ